MFFSRGEEVAEKPMSGGLAPAVFGQVYRASHQLDGGSVHDVDEPLEAEGELGTTTAAKSGLHGLQMFQHRPEELLGQFGIALAVGVRKRVLEGRGGPAQRRQWPGARAQRVAHVVEAQRLGQLGVEQATTWLHGLKVRAWSSRPVWRARRGTRCSGMKLQSWPNRVNLPAVGLNGVLIFTPYLVAKPKPASQLSFTPQPLTL